MPKVLRECIDKPVALAHYCSYALPNKRNHHKPSSAGEAIKVTKTIKKYSGLVKRIAVQMMHSLPSNIEIDDLIQAGMIGLMEAIDRYEEVEGARFSSYAYLRIRGAMIDELREMDWLKRTPRGNIQRMEKAADLLQQRLFRAPRDSEIAREMGVRLADYQHMLLDAHVEHFVHFDEFVQAGDADFLERNSTNSVPDRLTGLLEEEARRTINSRIERLPAREKAVMEMHYEQGFSFRKIAKELGLSETRAWQLHGQAVARLQEYYRRG